MMPKWLSVLLFVGVILSVAAFFVVTKNEDVAPTQRESLRTLQSFHTEFRREDGSAYDDESLAQLLIAKGIPFRVEPASEKVTSPLNFELYFITREFSPSQQAEINQAFNQILANLSAGSIPNFQLQSLKKGVVTSELKLQLFFSEEFKQIADVESDLTDFNEQLNTMGLYGLKGLEIFIAERPLAEYLKEQDAARDKEASKGQIPNTGMK